MGRNESGQAPSPPADSDKRNWLVGIASGIAYVAVEMFFPHYDDTPNWVIPAWGVILVAICAATGNATSALWTGVACLAVSVLYVGFKWVRKSMVRSRDDDQPPYGRHSA